MSTRQEFDFAHLEQLLRGVDEWAEQERSRAGADKEQRNRQEAESRDQIEEAKTRRTTFEEYIRTCYTLLSKPLRIQKTRALVRTAPSQVRRTDPVRLCRNQRRTFQ
jgi:hypothetical protein